MCKLPFKIIFFLVFPQRHDSIYREYFWDSDCYPNAVYTHCYDPTETKMFAAGGPLALGLYGSYSAVWD